MYRNAKEGFHYVLTQKGYEASNDLVKHERKVGQPVFHFYEFYVPLSWLKKGYVEEVLL